MITLHITHAQALRIESALRFEVASYQDDLGEYPNDGDAELWRDIVQEAQGAFDAVNYQRRNQKGGE